MKTIFTIICLLILSVQLVSAKATTDYMSVQPGIQTKHVGDSVIFTAVPDSSIFSGPFTYQWSKGQCFPTRYGPLCQWTDITGATNASYKITSVVLTDSGYYSVTAKLSDGGQLTAMSYLFIIPPVFVQNINQQKLNSINAYVASHVIHINYSIQNRTDSAKFILYDIQGRVVWQKMAISGQELTYKPVVAGTYILRIDGNQIFEKKLIYTPFSK